MEKNDYLTAQKIFEEFMEDLKDAIRTEEEKEEILLRIDTTKKWFDHFINRRIKKCEQE
jgi:hypothetical protein